MYTHTSLWTEFWEAREELIDPSFSNHHAPESSLLDIRGEEMASHGMNQACLAREWLLMKQNSFIHVFKSGQLVVIALVTMTVFKRTQMTVDMVHSNYYMGSLFYSAIRLMTNGLAELPLTGSRLPILYKQRDLYFYPAWSYTVPAAILKIPFSFLDAVLWTALTYYAISYSPEPERFFHQLLILFLLHHVSVSQAHFIASVVRDPSAAVSFNVSTLLVMYLFGASLPAWLEWGFWISPLTYTQIGASLNEFHAPRWEKVSSSNATMGQQFLRSHAPGRSQTTISHQRVSKLKGEDSTNMTHGQELPHVGTSNDVSERKKKGIVLPFEPIAISFENVQDYVDTPKERLELEDILRSKKPMPGYLLTLILMKRGGRIIYAGELGKHSSKLIQYFEEIPGVPKFNANRNPATWMLEVTGPSAEAQLGSDFAYLYNKSHLCCTSLAERTENVTIEIPYILLQSLLFVTITYPAINFYWSAYKMIWYFYSMFCTLLYFNYFGMLAVSLSPTFEVASVLTSLCFTLMDLFTGFIIPGPQIPKWRVWSYWICPMVWSLKALVTSQYGDIKKEISVFGEPKSISAFLKSYYGYHHEKLGVAAFVLFSLPLVFALAFAFFIAKLNFQRR
ncbi:Pleiotropic drug resistance protein 3 [Vitis vinifera]|uniref:Pleiotropic drug resistance protein 3 n=1 Tax=Vitis vinifera TaxID=29760 RepID=A0A438IXV7_VITVI|nr:Pleiotropic drug resistance protein 3 [Vitis vinifera]